MVFASLALPTSAATVTTSSSAPEPGPLDVSNLADPTATQKWFSDVEHDAGQTFTPTTDGLLVSFTVWLSSPNPNDGGDENVDVRLGTISRPNEEFTFTEVYAENAAMAPSPEGDWEADDYLTFTFDTPQPVTAGVEYGIITDAQRMGNWRVGIPYRHRTPNLYEGGVMINRGNEAPNTDLVFHAQIIPGSTEVFSLNLTPNAANPGHFDFSWASKDGKVYTLVSSTDLSTSPDTWPVWQENENLAGTAPTNILTNIPADDSSPRFFAVIEKDAPTGP
jgi:hypothetical protein